MTRQQSLRPAEVGTDERGSAIQLSHVFGVAITSALLVVVLTSSAAFVDQEQRDVARTQLDTIGNELATDVQHVDKLGQSGANVTFRTTVPATVAGKDYEVSLAEDDDCQDGNVRADDCLILETVDGDVTTRVPVEVNTTIVMQDEGGGTFRLTATGGTASAADLAENEVVPDRTLRVGVGSDFDVPRLGAVTGPVNTPPIADYSPDPDKPQVDEDVTFNGSASFDSDGDIVNYTWNFSDGSPDKYGEKVTKSFAEPGTYTVNLTVTDDRNASATTTQEIPVTGLVLDSDFVSGELAHGEQDAAVNFTLRNRWNEKVEVRQVVIAPHDSDVSELYLRRYSRHEDGDPVYDNRPLYVDVEDNGSKVQAANFTEPYVESGWGFSDWEDGRPVSIQGIGLVHNFDGSERATIPGNEVARVSIGDFYEDTGSDTNADMEGEVVTIRILYEVDGKIYVSTFTERVNPP